ncbi:MAG: glycerol-3-phosphate 1-O-acyltransferase PlsY [Deltaproteobacteria bacterium]|nr:glycerol-3-phosphate 1-O-acyltransferase PlsY [Deltaproteobacteria bacterium]
MTSIPIHLYLFIPLAYVLGSIPTGIIVARLLGGVDPREAGSGNIGATNVSRTAGKLAGVITLAGDAAKGALPACGVWYFRHEPLLLSLVGLSAFIGHLYPVFLKFKGGKGVATALGVLVVVSPLATLLSVIVFAVTVAVKRYVSLGSILASAVFPVFLAFLPGGRVYVPMGVMVSVLIIIKHKDNIKRLVEGTENGFR